MTTDDVVVVRRVPKGARLHPIRSVCARDGQKLSRGIGVELFMHPTDEARVCRFTEVPLCVQLVNGSLHADVGARFEL
jgi:hypothetical protein